MAFVKSASARTYGLRIRDGDRNVRYDIGPAGVEIPDDDLDILLKRTAVMGDFAAGRWGPPDFLEEMKNPESAAAFKERAAEAMAEMVEHDSEEFDELLEDALDEDPEDDADPVDAAWVDDEVGEDGDDSVDKPEPTEGESATG